jgi:hypothetical protein
MAYSLYKARGMSTKVPPCAICVDRTRGRSVKLTLGYGVTVWLCAAHADVDFLTKRSGRDFVRTMMGIWSANGCMTRARHRALDAHMAALQPRPRTRPGSYAWPRLRVRAEQLYSQGATARAVSQQIDRAPRGVCERPSLRTLYRWRAEQRHLSRAGPVRASA